MGNCENLLLYLPSFNEHFETIYKALIPELDVGRFDDEEPVNERWNTCDQTTKDAVIDTLKELQSNLTVCKDGDLSDTKLREFFQKIGILEGV